MAKSSGLLEYKLINHEPRSKGRWISVLNHELHESHELIVNRHFFDQRLKM